jgi:hypothetical protein
METCRISRPHLPNVLCSIRVLDEDITENNVRDFNAGGKEGCVQLSAFEVGIILAIFVSEPMLN